MFVILWEFEVKPGSEPAFERVYGPQGDWVRLFRSDPQFRMTRLLQDSSRPRIYCTMDFWDSEVAYENFKNIHRAAYQALDQATEGLTLSERHLGSFLQSDAATPSP
ncbi:MAG: antibiotic biosynthesis monooxygenase [Candidatus Acidiferrum sp.]